MWRGRSVWEWCRKTKERYTMRDRYMPYHNDTRHEQYTDQEVCRSREAGRPDLDGFGIREQKVWVEKHAQFRTC